MLRSLKTAALVALSLFCLPATSRADFSFDLDTGNSSSLGAGPFATVTVHVTSNTTATVTFTAKSGYAFVDGGSLGLNVNSNITSSNAKITSSTTSPAETLTLANPLPTNEDGFGKFNVVYDQKDSSNPAFVEQVDLTGVGTNWLTGNTSVSNQTILVANSNGSLAAAHVFVVGSNGVTGFAAGSGGPTPPVNTAPAPPSVLLLAVGGLCCAGFLARRRRPSLAAV
jgi:hypothetical protein